MMLLISTPINTSTTHPSWPINTSIHQQLIHQPINTSTTHPSWPLQKSALTPRPRTLPPRPHHANPISPSAHQYINNSSIMATAEISTNTKATDSATKATSRKSASLPQETVDYPQLYLLVRCATSIPHSTDALAAIRAPAPLIAAEHTKSVDCSQFAMESEIGQSFAR
eukprot:scaffold1899_cov182-Alexandrium_tamarense.AAC.38